MRMDLDIDIAMTRLVAATHDGKKQNGESASESLYVNVSAANNRAASDSGYGISMHIEKVDINRLESPISRSV